MMPATTRPSPSADAIDVDFGRPFQKAIDQHRLPFGDDERFGHEPLQLGRVVANLHRPATEHITRPHQHRIADLFCLAARLFHRAGDAVGRLLQIQLVQQLLKLLAVLGRFDRPRRWCQ